MMRGEAGGFSLLELLLALTLTSIVSSASLAVLASARRAAVLQPALSERQQRLRVASDAIFADLSAAGASATNVRDPPFGRLVPAVLPFRAGPSGARRFDPFRPDTVTVLSAPDGSSQAVLDTPLAPADVIAAVRAVPGCPEVGSGRDPACGFVPGGRALVFDTSGAYDHLEIAGVVGSLLMLVSSGPGRSHTYPAGSGIVPIRQVTYYRRAASSQVMRYNGMESDAPAIDQVRELTFEYFAVPGIGTGPLAVLSPAELTDGPWRPDAFSDNRYDADLLRIRRIRVHLQLAVAKPSGIPDVPFTIDVTPPSLERTP